MRTKLLLLFVFSISVLSHTQTTSIPDSVFEQRLIDLGLDDVIDGQVLTTNIDSVTILDIDNLPVSNLSGIEDFIALETLLASNSSISSINVRFNTNLLFLDVSNTNIQSLNLNDNTDLMSLDVSGTRISSLDVKANTNLSTLNVSSNNFLNLLDVSDTNLSSIDLSSNPNLSILFLRNTNISELDLSSNPNLSSLDIRNTSISALDISNNPDVIQLILSSTSISSLDVSANANLSNLHVGNTNLSALDVSANTNLTFLSALNTLNLSTLHLPESISSLDISGTIITTLDLSLQTNLTGLVISNNSHLTQLNLQNGANTSIIGFTSFSTPNLFCIQVDDVAYANSNWVNIDPANNFSTACPCPQTTIAQNITAELDANGEVVITEADIYTNFLGDCVYETVTINPNTFTCDDLEFEGFSSQALDLDGSFQYAEIPNTPSLNLPNSWTLEGWIYPTGFNPGGDVVIDKYSGTSFFDEYSILHFGGNYFAEVTTSDGNFAVNGGPVTLNQWTHIAGVYDQVNGTLSIYINGTLQNTATGITGSSLSTTNNTILGGVDWGNATFTGTIDELRIWDRALTAQEIADQRSQILSSDEPNLVGYFRIEQGPGNNTLLDSSPNNNTASFFNLDANTDWNTLNTATVNGEPGVIPVILTVTDGNNNSSITPLQVTVVDNLAPNVITQDVTVTINCNNPTATITADAINNGSTDNCQILNIDLDITSFDETNLGENIVTLTVTDTSGNSNSETAIVNVINTTQIIYVDQNATGSNTGENWTNAYTDLQSAIDQATTCSIRDQIWVAAGIYKPSVLPRNSTPLSTLNFFDDRNFSFHLVNNVAMYGGFSGNENDISERNLGLNPTILSGDIGVLNDNSDNILNIITSINDSANTIVDGFIIEEANADRGFPIMSGDPCEADPCPDNSGPDGGATIEGQIVTFTNGAAINATNTSIKIQNCIFRANAATILASLYFGSGGLPLISNTLFYNNTGNLSVLFIDQIGSTQAELSNLTFINNTLNLPIGSNAIASTSSLSTIKNSVFFNNTTGIDIVSSNANSTNNFISNSGGNGTLLTTDPFVNSMDIDGSDDILGTIDDGLIPAQGSALIDAGIALPNTPLTDITGRTRIVGLAIDVGAYEFQQTLSNTDFNFSNYSIYPNPTNSILNIKGLKTSEEVEIYNISGQKLFTKTIDLSKNTIDVSQLSTGIYFLKIDEESIKFIKN
ncbi:LamG-like jellyroll fold domain-containing protein [uncultured Winogradskyella sp.]|uniref:LamG-like jellyroll fold domain-containing protein n=1 Tax=uncultured Winogradskyella sp. TaxID=395353 RepID=UPI00262B63F7|nr:LamG-like jellyroll fold domain-containing protein [uncultured Winogradskyella sp.]